MPVASADPGGANPKAQYRTLSSSDGKTYQAGYVGLAAGDFFIVGSTSIYALKSLTLYLPSGPQTYDCGLPGFTSGQLVTCSYTDPQAIYTVGEGFFTPST